MRKASVIIFISFFLFACQSKEKNEQNVKIENTITDSITNSSSEEKNSLNGTWGLTNYFDTIIRNKEIAKYRIQTPTWFAILLKFENDTLISFGSFNNYKFSLFNSDTVCVFDDFGKWVLLNKGDVLILKNILTFSNKPIDTVEYIYIKRDDLSYITKDINGWVDLMPKMTDYFNENIMSGSYNYLGKKIEFSSNGEIKGNLNKHRRYEVRNSFHTFHPFKNLDVISFLNDEKEVEEFYNWKFEGDKLILTEFVSSEETDDYILGKKKLILTKD
jgi:hypothetical protein